MSVNYKISDAFMLDVGVNHVKEKVKSGVLSVTTLQNSQSRVPGLGFASTTGYGIITDRIDASIMASRMWGTGASVSGIGVEVGTRLLDNMWLGLSYNKGKFVDTELFSSNASWTGWHLRLNYKFH